MIIKKKNTNWTNLKLWNGLLNKINLFYFCFSMTYIIEFRKSHNVWAADRNILLHTYIHNHKHIKISIKVWTPDNVDHKCKVVGVEFKLIAKWCFSTFWCMSTLQKKKKSSVTSLVFQYSTCLNQIMFYEHLRRVLMGFIFETVMKINKDVHF